MRPDRTAPEPDRPATSPPGRLTARLSTVRGRILMAFLAMSLITGALGSYAGYSAEQAGILVNRTYDESLMSINFARAAAADFAKMRAAFSRRWLTADPTARAKLDREIADLAGTLADDLAVAVERSQTERAARAGVAVQAAATAWDEIRHKLDPTLGATAAWEALDHQADIVDQQIDLLVNYTAGDGFTYRQAARAAVAQEIRVLFGATLVAIGLAGFVAWQLGRRIIRPLAVASAVAERIAAGRLDGTIPTGARDELGALLRAMAAMRDNIRAMMAREVDQRRSAQTLLADALQGSSEGVVVVDAQGRIVLANAQAIDFFRTDGGAAASRTAELADGASAAAVIGAVETLKRDGEVRLSDGRWLRISRSPTQAGGFVAMCSDISVLKEQEARLTATNLRLDAALENMSQGLVLYDAEGRLRVANRRYREIYALGPDALPDGTHYTDVLRLSLAQGNHPGRSLDDLLLEASATTTAERYSLVQELVNGRIVAIEKRATADGGLVATFEDVTERRQAEARISFLDRHDALTGLPNRVQVREHVEAAIASAGRESGFALLCLNISDFKAVNDTLGHPAGDALLCAVAARLSACLREIDFLGRLGGDEFAIVQRAVDRPEDAAIFARRILDVVGEPYTVDGQTVMVGASIGLTLAPHDGMTVEKVLKNADVALERARAESRGGFRFFEPGMDARLQARRLLEIDLREAVAAQDFELHYQPIYDLGSEQIGGFEALLRWNHPTRGRVPPVEFIPLAEELGLIVPLGEWALRKACQEAATWPEQLKVAVNVSAIQFGSSRLVGAVREALIDSGLPGRRLELEITESILVSNPAAVTAILHTLHGLGVRISMDDFGTGYSSLSYLRSFPFDKIKIDQSFVRDLCEPDGSGFIVRAVIGLGASLRMTTTAEGVETEEQLAHLRDEGCDEIQGYLISRPVPASEVPRLIAHWNGATRAIA